MVKMRCAGREMTTISQKETGKQKNMEPSLFEAGVINRMPLEPLYQCGRHSTDRCLTLNSNKQKYQQEKKRKKKRDAPNKRGTRDETTSSFVRSWLVRCLVRSIGWLAAAHNTHKHMTPVKSTPDIPDRPKNESYHTADRG